MKTDVTVDANDGGAGPRPDSGFASDNTSGICPEAWRALEQANAGYAPGYGTDDWTARAAALIREVFEADCEVFFCFTGTAANAMAIAHLCRPFHSVICHESAHIETDECGGPEFFSHGSKILLASGDDGRIVPEDVAELVQRRTDIHYPKPHVLSLTQPTELGTVYRVDEVRRLCTRAHELGLQVHMDGARFANAVSALGVKPREITWEAGVDVLCLGGTKCGLPMGEAVIFFDRRMADEFDYRCKQAGQLASKMRFIAAPWVGLLQGGAWLRHARHANAMTQQLAERMTQVPGVRLLRPVEVNAVFVTMPGPLETALRERGWAFYNFIGGGIRLMCSWATTTQAIDHFTRDAEDSARSFKV